MITEQTNKRELDLYEVIELFDKQETREKQIEVLRTHNSAPLRDYLQCLFDDRVQFLLPEGKPPYNACREESAPSSWHKRNIDLKYIVKGLVGEQLLPYKRESIFIGILETIHPRDAELIANMVCKKPTSEKLTKDIVQEAFPNLIVEEQAEMSA